MFHCIGFAKRTRQRALALLSKALLPLRQCRVGLARPLPALKALNSQNGRTLRFSLHPLSLTNGTYLRVNALCLWSLRMLHKPARAPVLAATTLLGLPSALAGLCLPTAVRNLAAPTLLLFEVPVPCNNLPGQTPPRHPSYTRCSTRYTRLSARLDVCWHGARVGCTPTNVCLDVSSPSSSGSGLIAPRCCTYFAPV